MNGNILCATAGWTDPTLTKGTAFYPKTARAAQDRLAHYSQHFPLVEVDATYYALLPVTNAYNWLQWTPPLFIFNIKAHPVLTGHPIEVARLPSDLRQAIEDSDAGSRVYADRLPEAIAQELEQRFYGFLEPLLTQQRLGALMLQFPPWFTATKGNAQRIESLAERWRDVPLAVEFRHASWNETERRKRVLDLLKAHDIALVCTDEPQHGESAADLHQVTSSRLAIVRFHGRNAQGWAKKRASVHERFSYLYAEDELSRWVPVVRQLATEAKAVHAIFNNCYRDYAVLNAKNLAALLTRS